MDYMNAVYIAALNSKRTDGGNILAHNRLRARLESGLYRYEEAYGVYKNVPEPCFIVDMDTHMISGKLLYGDLLELATEFGQDTILIVRNGDATLQFTSDGRCEPLGKLVRWTTLVPMTGDRTELRDGSVITLESDVVRVPFPARKAA